MFTRTGIGIWGLTLGVALTATSAWAEPLSAQSRAEINRLGSTQGRSANEINPLLDRVNKAGERGLPTEPLLNKVREGLAKGVDPKRIEPVLRQMMSRLESAHEVLEEAKDHGIVEGNRQRALEMMAEALGRGATIDEVRELSRLSEDGRHRATQDELAAGAKGLAVMKEGGIPAKEGTALVGEGIRQGYRPSELLELGREVKRRGSDFEDGHASLEHLREQVSHGERVDRLFREDRSGSGDGDHEDRSDRGSRGSRSDRIESEHDRAERHDRSGGSDRRERIERHEHEDRLERPDRSGHD
jgi:hypothetical protein